MVSVAPSSTVLLRTIAAYWACECHYTQQYYRWTLTIRTKVHLRLVIERQFYFNMHACIRLPVGPEICFTAVIFLALQCVLLINCYSSTHVDSHLSIYSGNIPCEGTDTSCSTVKDRSLVQCSRSLMVAGESNGDRTWSSLHKQKNVNKHCPLLWFATYI